MIHPKMKFVYCGIDSHKETHYAVILNCFFEKLGELEFPNVPSEFENFFAQVKKFRLKGTAVSFGLEDVSAYGRALTVFLTAKKQKVKHVNASLVASERSRMNVLQKTDSIDAECAARVLLNSFDILPDADPQDKYWVLSNLVTRRRSAVKANTALKNQLHSFIVSHYPSYSKFYANIDCKSSLAFFEKYPSPSKLESVTVEELEEFLKEVTDGTQYKGKAQLILSCIKKDGNTKTSYQDARDMSIISVIKQIKHNLQEIESIESILEGFLENFDYKLESMRGIDTVTAANLIAEIGDIKRFSTPAKLARYSGIAPVTYASGKSDVQFSNERGNRVLNSIFFRLSVVVTMTAGVNKKIINPYFYNYYNKKISEGKTKRQALKCVQRRLVNIIWGMMTHKREYINPPTEDFQKETSKT
jgi:transposase